MVFYSILLAVLLLSISAHCDSSSASSGATSSSDGNGSTFTQTSNNGQGTFTSNGPAFAGGPQGFGNPAYGNTGFQNGYGPQPGYYGPYNPASNFGGFNNPFGGNFGHYGPGFNYASYPNGVPPYQPSSPFGFQAPFGPQPLLTPQEFNQQLQQYIISVKQQYESLYKRQQDYVNAWKESQNAYGPGSGSNYGGPNYAYATGAYTPNGIHQTAGIYPPNKNKPNIDTRFDPEDASGKPFKKPNYFGVSTSSFSSSSKGPDGEYHKEGAITAVNDNGKVTIHKIES